MRKAYIDKVANVHDSDVAEQMHGTSRVVNSGVAWCRHVVGQSYGKANTRGESISSWVAWCRYKAALALAK
ncbi:hypothetical protein Acr_02g0007470 [Actinidia rufa]|uniref:Uncharacterized protein n=1 Tax=Actinidia rufa TaxID=165716 RepID=A0A7J0EA23_9ERIC|nr:hypothetical protein Acr_02g0007470 [Actinidia rufa]